jgi:hypothetical protein
MARARSSTPAPLPYSGPTASIRSSSPPSRQSREGPSKPFGSGSASVPEVPVTSTRPARVRWDSKLNTATALAPLVNSRSALCAVGTFTGNWVPARGPELMTRVARDREEVALTRRTGPKTRTRAVR